MNNDKIYRRSVFSWAMYDWANSAFATTIMVAMLPPFFRALAVEGGLAENRVTPVWAFISSGAMLLVAIFGPILGAIADHTGGKKKYLAVFLALGSFGSAMLVTASSGLWWLAALWFILGFIGFACGNVFYESLLPHVARNDDLDRVSSLGYALGYCGGGILLVVNAIWVTKPEWFGLSGTVAAVRLSFFSVAVWWLLFSIPLFRNVSEPKVPPKIIDIKSSIRSGFGRLYHTIRNLRRYRQLLLFLVAFWLYNDGIGTIMKMATIYGGEIGIDEGHMIKALVLTQFIGFPCAIGFGILAKRIGAKAGIFVGLVVYGLICLAGFYMKTPIHFYILAGLVGIVQGGTQALSRSLFGSMTPRHMSSEFFGFMSTSSRFAGVFGPLFLGIVGLILGSTRMGILLLILFFILGGALLLFVNVDEGQRVAREDEELYVKSLGAGT